MHTACDTTSHGVTIEGFDADDFGVWAANVLVDTCNKTSTANKYDVDLVRVRSLLEYFRARRSLGGDDEGTIEATAAEAAAAQENVTQQQQPFAAPYPDPESESEIGSHNRKERKRTDDDAQYLFGNTVHWFILPQAKQEAH